MSHIHLPDGVLPWWLWGSAYLIVILLIALFGLRKSAKPDPKRFALLGIIAALMILVMSIELPLVPYHVNLSVVGGIVLGPGLGLIAVFIVNLFLSMVGHGGITTVGLNTLVMAIEMLVGYGVFRGLLRLRAPLALAAFLAVVIGLGCGTTASYGVIYAGAPAINQTLARSTHDEHATVGHREAAGGHHHEHETLEQAATGGRLNLTRLAVLMFGLGAIGWVLEGLLSAVVLGTLNRIYPDLLVARREEPDGSL